MRWGTQLAVTHRIAMASPVPAAPLGVTATPAIACSAASLALPPPTAISPWIVHSRASPRAAGGVGGLHRADIARALVGSLVGPRGQRQHSAHRGDRRISLAGHPSGQAVEQDGGVPGAVPDQ